MTSFSVLQHPSLSSHCLTATQSFNCRCAECSPCVCYQQDLACGLCYEMLLIVQGSWEVGQRKTLENAKHNLNKTLRVFSRSTVDHVLVSKAEHGPPAACAGPGGASPEVSMPGWWSGGYTMSNHTRVVRMAPSPADLVSISLYFTLTENQ